MVMLSRIKPLLKTNVIAIITRSTGQMHTNGLFETIDGFKIHYMRSGLGKHNILLFPGPMGCARTDYSHFLTMLNRENFTAVAWDPPGQGASIPPTNRSWMKPGRLERDAQIALKLTQQLNLVPFSMLGWSEGALTALLTASYSDPKDIRKLLLWAYDKALPCPGFLPACVQEDPRTWPISCRAPLEATYGIDYLVDTWKQYIAAKKEGYLISQDETAALESRLRERFIKGNSTVWFMRAPGQRHTEDWLTYMITKMHGSRVLNWMDFGEAPANEHTYNTWGPHRAHPEQFQDFVQNYLSN